MIAVLPKNLPPRRRQMIRRLRPAAQRAALRNRNGRSRVRQKPLFRPAVMPSAYARGIIWPAYVSLGERDRPPQWHGPCSGTSLLRETNNEDYRPSDRAPGSLGAAAVALLLGVAPAALAHHVSGSKSVWPLLTTARLSCSRAGLRSSTSSTAPVASGSTRSFPATARQRESLSARMPAH